MSICNDFQTFAIGSRFLYARLQQRPVDRSAEPLASRLPRYPTATAVLIGRLGRDRSYAGLGLGEALLFDAIKTVAGAQIGAHAIFADAMDEMDSGLI